MSLYILPEGAPMPRTTAELDDYADAAAARVTGFTFTEEAETIPETWEQSLEVRYTMTTTPTDHPNRDLPTPDRVDWSEVTPVLPRTWRPVRRPVPVPGGALVVVSQPVPSLRRTLHTVLFWSASTGSIYNYEPVDAHVRDTRRAVFAKTGDAFAAAEKWGAWHRLPLDPKPWKGERGRRFTLDQYPNGASTLEWAPRPQYVPEREAYAGE